MHTGTGEWRALCSCASSSPAGGTVAFLSLFSSSADLNNFKEEEKQHNIQVDLVDYKNAFISAVIALNEHFVHAAEEKLSNMHLLLMTLVPLLSTVEGQHLQKLAPRFGLCFNDRFV